VVYRFVHLFKTVEDPRAEGMIDYPLGEILLIAFLALLSDCSKWTEIEDFGKDNQRWLKKFLKLKNGVPSHDTYRRVFSLIDPAQLQDAITNLLLENMTALKQAMGIKKESYRHLCIDGKEERGTGRKYGTTEKVPNLQTLHIYDATNSICLVSEPISEKTNEIPVAQKFLEKMNLKGCIVTFDSLHTQVNTIRLIVGQKVTMLADSREIRAPCFPERKAFSRQRKGRSSRPWTDVITGKVRRLIIRSRPGTIIWSKPIPL